LALKQPGLTIINQFSRSDQSIDFQDRNDYPLVQISRIDGHILVSGGSVKVNLEFEIRRFGRIVRVGGILQIYRGVVDVKRMLELFPAKKEQFAYFSPDMIFARFLSAFGGNHPRFPKISK